MVYGNGPLKGIRMYEVEQGLPLGLGSILIFTKQQAVRFHSHYEVLEVSRVVE